MAWAQPRDRPAASRPRRRSPVRRILALSTILARHVEIGAGMDIDVADAFEMREHRHARFALARARSGPCRRAARSRRSRRSSPPSMKPTAGAIARRHELDRGLRQACRVQRLAQVLAMTQRGSGSSPTRRAGSRHCRTSAHSAAASAVTLGRDFIDDADHAERHAHARDVETVGPRPARRSPADRIGKAGDLAQALGHRLDARLVRAPAGRAKAASRPLARAASTSCALAARILPAFASHPLRPWLGAQRSSPRCGASASAAAASRAAAPYRASSRSRLCCSRLLSAIALTQVFRSAPDRRDGSSRRGHGSRESRRFHCSCGR